MKIKKIAMKKAARKVEFNSLYTSIDNKGVVTFYYLTQLYPITGCILLTNMDTGWTVQYDHPDVAMEGLTKFSGSLTIEQ